MINCTQFRTLIIEPVLSKLQVYSKSAEELLVFTCAAESDGGTFISQIKGPAMGVYQMEPLTYTDIWVNYVRHYNRLSTLMALHLSCSKIPEPERMIYDMAFSTAMARLHYLRVKEKLPAHDDVDGLWGYYKQYWNTVKGKSKKDESIKKYEKFLNN